MVQAGYTEKQAAKIKDEVAFYEDLRSRVKLQSADAVDLKRYESKMRHLIDAYIESKESVAISAFDDLSLIQLIVERGAAAVDALPERTRKNRTSVAETIENNVRRLIVDQSAINPKYYGTMSALLDALIAQRKTDATNYEKYLAQIVELTRKAKSGPQGGEYPVTMNSPAKRALFDNLGRDEALALAVDGAVRASRQDEWRSNTMKSRKVRGALAAVLPEDPELVDRAFELVKNQHEY